MASPEGSVTVSNVSDVEENNQGRDNSTEDERLVKSRPRNNFPSYSNAGVDVRFRVRLSFIVIVDAGW